MKILIVSTYYNAPHFMKLQVDSIRKFVAESFDFIAINDADIDTKSVLSGKLASGEIYDECNRLNVKQLRVPQTVHRHILDGGLVPNDMPTSHPTERHRACIHWLLRYGLESIDYKKYDALMLMESDLFVYDRLDIHGLFKNYDIVGSGSKNRRLVKTGAAWEYWPERLGNCKEITLDFFNSQLLIVNMNTVANIDKLNISGFAGSDTGAMTGLFLKDNQNYRYRIVNTSPCKEEQIDLFFVMDDTKYDLIHYRGGSNWDYQNIEYYTEKLNRMINKYMLSSNKLPTSKINLTSRDNEHTFYGE